MDEPFVGEIMLFAFSSFVPQGWLKCDGTVYNWQPYQALFALIGNTYGGNAQQQTFAVPDLTGAEPDPHTMYCIAYQGIWPPRPY
ncbi:tail fiber protein [Heliobacterium gestii]|uniref:Tail fiber protein n=1 Tax=Heliomicrobium gestii TaxID=2699 RepID=A0A845LJR1_HELGE|nr:phage tail protein [Heliomicrobium gestii]MBM7868452.1 microcystin-dependent protein [Heliomicrobium gestii]MZP44625.1 tail fiber protein [Heliomicrobium gestii]